LAGRENLEIEQSLKAIVLEMIFSLQSVANGKVLLILHLQFAL